MRRFSRRVSPTVCNKAYRSVFATRCSAEVSYVFAIHHYCMFSDLLGSKDSIMFDKGLAASLLKVGFRG